MPFLPLERVVDRHISDAHTTGVKIVFLSDGSDRPRPCVDLRGTSSSTVTNTDEIVVRGTEIDESFRIDQSNGAFARHQG